MRGIVSLSVLLAMLVPAAGAQSIPMPPELKAYVMRPDQQKAVLNAMFSYWHALVPECSTPQFKQMNVIVISQPVFDATGNPTSGSWRMAGHIEGCGEDKIMNVLYWFGADGKMKMTQMLPGTTIADLLLEKDAIFYARTGMMGLAPKDCKEARILDTKFIRFDGTSPQTMPGRDNRTWSEEWTVRTCSVTGVVPMHFIPDATGTTIHSEIVKAAQ